MWSQKKPQGVVFPQNSPFLEFRGKARCKPINSIQTPNFYIIFFYSQIPPIPTNPLFLYSKPKITHLNTKSHPYLTTFHNPPTHLFIQFTQTFPWQINTFLLHILYQIDTAKHKYVESHKISTLKTSYTNKKTQINPLYLFLVIFPLGEIRE